ncbi:MAG: hypothetical protein ACK58L_21815 [Planctomycetota bacterium]
MSLSPIDDQNYNPFAAPSSLDVATSVPGQGGPEEIRRELLNHEASIQSIGLLYLLGSVLLIIIGIVSVATAPMPRAQARSWEIGAIAGVLIVMFGLLQAFVGIGLRQLRGWTRIPVGIVSGIGLLGFPVGTFINGYILYLMFSQKGSRVLSPEYQEIIRQTPHIRYRTPLLVKIFAFLLIVMLALGVFSLLFA